MKHKSAFSILELLVAIGIIGLLVALVLPAIQASRSAARKTQCQTNLRQIGIALHNYHSQFELFPPMSVWGGPPGEPLGNGEVPIGVIDRLAIGEAKASGTRLYSNWLCLILPQLGELVIYDKYSPEHPVADSRNEFVRTRELRLLKCPSDSHNGPDNHYQRDILGTGEENLYARGNYGINFGPDRSCLVGFQEDCDDGFFVDDPDLANSTSVLWGSGVAGVNKSMKFADFTRGQSEVVMVEELRAGIHSVDPRGTWALGFVGASATARHGLAYDGEDAYGPNNNGPESDDIVGCSELKLRLFSESELMDMGMPCHIETPIESNSQATSRSMHEGGVFVLMADGSSQFISNSISLEVWYEMHCRNTK